eukprot:331114-Karenia_brevis.AAC.1
MPQPWALERASLRSGSVSCGWRALAKTTLTVAQASNKSLTSALKLKGPKTSLKGIASSSAAK